MQLIQFCSMTWLVRVVSRSLTEEVAEQLLYESSTLPANDNEASECYHGHQDIVDQYKHHFQFCRANLDFLLLLGFLVGLIVL